jgi:hypothetical protein
LTIKACVTPGSHAKRVSKRLITKVLPIPCFKNTASGGRIMFKMMVRIDILKWFK